MLGAAQGYMGSFSPSFLVFYKPGIPLETEPGQFSRLWEALASILVAQLLSPGSWQVCVCVSGLENLKAMAAGKCCLWKQFSCPQTKAYGQGPQVNKQAQEGFTFPLSPHCQPLIPPSLSLGTCVLVS